MAGSRCWLVTKPDAGGSGRLPAGFVDLQIAQRRPHHRGIQTKPVGAAHEIADDMFALGWTRVLDIGQQRWAVVGGWFTPHLDENIPEPVRWGISFGAADPGALIEGHGDNARSGSCGGDLAGPCLKQPRDRE